jgi:hypothetical protein
MHYLADTALLHWAESSDTFQILRITCVEHEHGGPALAKAVTGSLVRWQPSAEKEFLCDNDAERPFHTDPEER